MRTDTPTPVGLATNAVTGPIRRRSGVTARAAELKEVSWKLEFGS
jgi:hypothetical protein